MNTRPSDYFSIKRAFNRAAQAYSTHAVIQHEIGRRLIESLRCFNLHPKKVLDIGTGDGLISQQLQQAFETADLYSIDLAEAMIQGARKIARAPTPPPIYFCVANAESLPFHNQSMDFVFSNFTLQWCLDLQSVLSEALRVLNNESPFAFSIPGPDTLQELKIAFQSADPDYQHVNDFIDMHNIGDALIQTGFADPVIHMEKITLTYSSVRALLKDIQHIGAHTILGPHRKTLLGKEKLQKLYQSYEPFKTPEGRYPATYEVIYAHAFKPKVKKMAKYPENREFTVPVSTLLQKHQKT
jgi:malonyl-CoA O-methyltransferase